MNLLGEPLDERPVFLARLLPMLQDLRERYGRPHQLVIDESRNLLPKDSDLPSWKSVQGAIFITAEPDSIALEPLRSVDILVATGETGTIEQFTRAVGVTASVPCSGRLNEAVRFYGTGGAIGADRDSAAPGSKTQPAP